MWRKILIISLTVISGAAIPKAGRKDVLHRLVRLPQTEFASPLVFDRANGFVVFPNQSSATSDAAELLKDLKGVPADAPLFLEAGRILARADMASAIRSYARATELFERKAELESGQAGPLIGLADACLALGRFAEAQAALDKAEALNADRTELARARFHKEKAWSLFAGEENRFTTTPMLEIIERIVARKSGVRIEAAKQELELAAAAYDKRANGASNDVLFLDEHAKFASFYAALQTAFAQLQGAENSSRALRRSVFADRALDDLARLAELRPGDARYVATAAFARAFAESGEPIESDAELSSGTRTYLLKSCRQLEVVAEGGSKQAAQAAELLGCARMFLLRDSSGGERSARAALRLQPEREAAWDLLACALISEGRNSEFVQTCEDRLSAQPSARGSALLMKAYAFDGQSTQAEWNGLLAAALYPNDLEVNLTLAALLLQRENYREVLWRAGAALAKAEKQIAGGTRHTRLEFALLKSIYFGLSDQPEQARTLLNPYARSERAAEVQEVLRALD